tara:strand:+ start:835 stop:1341 length:507 start_codon:yes stop_codon:yes gene_type:complete
MFVLIYALNNVWQMKIIFSRKTCILPQLIKEWMYYDTCIEWLINTPEKSEIEHLKIEYLDRGVKNWKLFGTHLKTTFPNLKYLTFEMNYYYNHEKDDEWKTAETFFVEMKLDYLSIEWFQEFENCVVNESGSDSYSIKMFLSEDFGDDPSDFEEIRKQMPERIQMFIN